MGFKNFIQNFYWNYPAWFWIIITVFCAIIIFIMLKTFFKKFPYWTKTGAVFATIRLLLVFVFFPCSFALGDWEYLSCTKLFPIYNFPFIAENILESSNYFTSILSFLTGAIIEMTVFFAVGSFASFIIHPHLIKLKTFKK